MSALTRGVRVSSAFVSLFRKRCFHHSELITIRFTHNLCEKFDKDVFCKRKIPAFGQQVVRKYETIEGKKGLQIIYRMNKIIEREKKITPNELMDCFEVVDMSEELSSSNAASLIKFTGSCLDLDDVEVKQNILLEAWTKVEQKAKLDASIFNALIKAYAENGMQSSWHDILSEMAVKGVEPNKDTYLILLRLFCIEGDLKLAREIVTKMLETGLSQTVEIYNCLFIGLSKIGDLDGIDELYGEMQMAQVLPNSETYIILLKTYALSNAQKFQELLGNLRNTWLLFSPEELMEIIRPLIEINDEGTALEVLKVLPRMTNRKILREVDDIIKREKRTFWRYPGLKMLFHDIFDERTIENIEFQGVTPPVVEEDVEQRHLQDFIQCYYDKNFEKFEELILETGIDKFENDFHVLSCLVSYYSVHKKDLKTAKEYWKPYMRILTIVAERIAMERKHNFYKLSKKFIRIALQPVADYSCLLMDKQYYNEVVEVLDFAKMIPSSQVNTELVDFRPLLYSCLCHGKGDRKKRTYDLTVKVKELTKNSQSDSTFLSYLIERNPSLVMDFWWYITSVRRKTTSMYEIFVFLIKNNQKQELMEVIDRVFIHYKTDQLIPTLMLAAAYITTGKQRIAKNLFEKGEFVIGKNKEKMDSLEKFFFYISKDPNKTSVLQDLIDMTERVIPLILHIRLNLILAKVYAFQELFDKARDVLKICDSKATDSILEECTDIIAPIKQKFEFTNQHFPLEFKMSVKSSEIEKVADQLTGKNKFQAEDWILSKLGEGNTDMIHQLVRELAKRDNVDSIFKVGRLLKNCGEPGVLISLCDIVSEVFPRDFIEGWRRNIPLAYYEGYQFQLYMDYIKNNDSSVETCEISPQLLKILWRSCKTYFYEFVELAEDSSCKHQAGICNALFCFYIESDMEKAQYYFQKIPETRTLEFMKFALVEVFKSGQPENVEIFWKLVADRLIKPDYIKNRIISFYYTQNMLEKVLDHFYDALGRNIQVYEGTANCIVSLCEKRGREIPDEVLEILKNAPTSETDQNENQEHYT